MGNKIIFFVVFLLLIFFSCTQSEKKTTDKDDKKKFFTGINKISIINYSNFDTFSYGDFIEIMLEYLPDNVDSILVKVNGLSYSEYITGNNKISFELEKNVRAGKNNIEVKFIKEDSVFLATLNIIVKSKLPPQRFSYRIIRTYPHDESSYTQGLEFYDGYMYEGSGQYGFSSLRKYNIENNEILLSRNLPSDVFGEGIVIFDNKIYQLTWQSHIVYVFNLNDFSLIRTFENPTEGWGLTKYKNMLVMSDGTNTLYFLNPDNFSEIKRIEVYDNNAPVNNLNELEYIPPYIYANVYQTDKIVMINPETGFVEGEIDLTNLLNRKKCTRDPDVLNGIAYDYVKKRIFVTGKYWPEIYQIELIKK